MLRIAVILTITVITGIASLFIFSPIAPVSWKAPDIKLSSYSCASEKTHRLSASPFVKNLPATTDGLAMADGGRLFAAMKNGQIAEVDIATGAWKIIAKVEGVSFLGISAAQDGSYIFAVDQKSNSVYYFDLTSKIYPVTGKLLVSHFNGKKLLWLNDVIHTDQYVYITVTSRNRHNSKFRNELLEHRPNGFILRYDRETEELKEIYSNLITTNGIALSTHNKIVVAETSAYRIREFSASGNGKAEFFDNLPGFPGNLTKSDRANTHWLSLVAVRQGLLDRLSGSPNIRRLLAWLPESLQPQPKPFPCVMELYSSQEERKARSIIISGKTEMPTFGTVLEHNGFLYISPYSSPTKPNSVDGRLFRVRLPQDMSSWRSNG